MKLLWIAFVIVATLGSVYPFNFTSAHLDDAALTVFMQSCCLRLGVGDIVGNVMLFVPIGFTGMFAIFRRRATVRRLVLVFASGVGIALFLQLLQFYLPSRDQNLQDVAWNGLGLIIGSALAPALARMSNTSELKLDGMSLVPLSLIGAWLTYRLIPFVPSLDLQNLKDSLKPLLIDVELNVGGVLHDLAGWLVIGYLLQFAQHDRKLDAWLPVMMACVLCLEVLIVKNSVSASGVLAAALAAGLWSGYLSRQQRQEGFLVAVLLLALLVAGLAPFVVDAAPARFNWLPFGGFLGGSMYLNTQSAAEKVFLYGSLVYLLWQTSANRLLGLCFAFLLVLSIEWVQVYVAGHTPEITDPLLIVFAALALLALERHDLDEPVAARQRSTLPASTAATFQDIAGATITMDRSWSTETVNLRGEQQDFLGKVAAEMGGTPSGVARGIIRDFIDEVDGEGESMAGYSQTRGSTPGAEPAAAGRERNDWRKQRVNLGPDEREFIRALSASSGQSISRVVRRVIQRFMDKLDG